MGTRQRTADNDRGAAVPENRGIADETGRELVERTYFFHEIEGRADSELVQSRLALPPRSGYYWLRANQIRPAGVGERGEVGGLSLLLCVSTDTAAGGGERRGEERRKSVGRDRRAVQSVCLIETRANTVCTPYGCALTLTELFENRAPIFACLCRDR